MGFLEEIGGIGIIRKVHRHFYDLVYSHPWFSQIFEPGSQPRLEEQQTKFMAQNFGGKEGYNGRMPETAHPHIMITVEMFDERARLLSDSIRAMGVSEEHHERWIRIDQAFRAKLVKSSVLECKGRFKTDPIINIPNPSMPWRRTG